MMKQDKSFLLKSEQYETPTVTEHFQTTPFVKLEHYSGPLDLLLNLIRKQEMDIFKIDIHKITHQYLEYLKQSCQPDLEYAGDFIRMACWLIYIKSKSLIPEEEEIEEPEAEELKQKLSRLLANYQKFQEAGRLLYQKGLLNRDCWNSSGTMALKPPTEEVKIEMDREKGMFQLIQSYHKILTDKKAKKSYKISKPIPSLLHRLKQTAELWRAGARLKFKQLVLFHGEKYSRLLSFLSILELSKAGFILLSQKQLFANIDIFVKKTVTESAMGEISPDKREKQNEKPTFR